MATAVPTLRGAVAAAAARLEAAGCDSPRLDAELLAAHALGVGRERIHLDAREPLEASAGRRFEELVARRAAREPVAYIVGRRAFRGIELAVDPRVLIPRPETELLVEVALELPAGAWVHDLGTGSGAIALALAAERPDLRVTASDVSPAALEVARSNARRLGLPVELSDGSGLPAADLVVANLPYVADGEWDALAPEIRLYEPRIAVVAGPDGLEAIRSAVADRGAAGAAIALEHAPAQAGAVRSLLADARTLRDLAGHERVTVGRLP
ncbi:MAG: peptide chain release factor N(5)-glutamine methyltransferase [Thermoleophilaceae bacterium]